MNKYCSVFATVAFSLFLLPCDSIAQQYRLVKETGGGYTRSVPPIFIVGDSTTYTYQWQSGRGSNYNNDTISFDTAYSYWLNMPQTVYREKEVKTYNSNNVLLTSTTYEYDDVDAIWKPKEADSFTVSNNGQVQTWLLYSKHNNKLVNNYGYNYSYDAQGRLVLQESLYNDTFWRVPLYPKQRNYFRYDNNGYLIVDSNVLFNMGSWKYIARTEHSYDANGNKVRSDIYGVSSGVLSLFEQEFFDYNTSGQLVRDSLYRFFSSTSYETHIYSYNAQGLLASDTFRSDAKVSIPLTIYQYTAFGYLSELTYASIDPTTKQAVPFSATRYYYQLYWPTGVKETSRASTEVSLYPNPATSVLHINTSEAYTQGRIYNSMGQMVQVVNANSQQVNIEALPVGNYYLQLTTDNKVMSKRFTVLR